ncbi:MAG: MMPL family transporter, partial [Solirubrobacterales bacterium]|nr:MMPL family transporter [Solirubrobacterales bacterium]
MRSGEYFERVVRAVARRPLVPLIAVAVIAVAGALFALRLEPSTGTDSLVSSGSETYAETERFKEQFGDDAVVVMVEGDLQRTLLTDDIQTLIRLEGCLSGNVPEEALEGLPEPCREIAELDPAQAVLGPGTFVNTIAQQVGAQLTTRIAAAQQRAQRAERRARRQAAEQGLGEEEQRAAGEAASERSLRGFQQQLLSLALRYGITDVPAVDSAGFVSALAFGRDGRTPKPQFSYLFPSRDAALIQVRLRPDLDDGKRRRAIELIRAATESPQLQPQQGARYVVTGVPVVVDGLADAVRGAIPWLLGAAILLMAATLALVFRSRLRLLPLALALAAAGITFGILALVGGRLTMASIAVLPVLIGLAVDYAIQFQARYDEVRRRTGDPPAVAAPAAARAGGPTIVTAGLATAIGFLALLTSPVPMVRDFGALLVVGIFVALGCALLAGFAALVRFGEPRTDRPPAPPILPRLRHRLGSAASALGSSRPGAALARRGRAVRIGAI